MEKYGQSQWSQLNGDLICKNRKSDNQRQTDNPTQTENQMQKLVDLYNSFEYTICKYKEMFNKI